MNWKLFSATVFVAVLAALTAPALRPNAAAATKSLPKFEADPYWPKPLPNNWMMGQVSGIYVELARSRLGDDAPANFG